MSETILVARTGDVTTITLNRPGRINAFNVEMHGALRSAVAHAAEDGTRCLVITGAGKGFCAGQDLSDRVSKPGDPPPDLGASLDARYNPLIRSLKALPMPVIAAVNGTAAGAGANLALACDIVVAARSAAFVQSFCKVGLIPDSGGTWTLPRLVGTARATALMMLGEKVTAEQAMQWGMIWRCVDDEQLLPTVLAMAAQLAAQPTRGLALMKKALARSGANTLDAQLDLERDLQTEAGCTQDYQEGVRAFMEKRPPRFEGR
ncbi:2-(1,2-epoxy-1,2-dihydrophenyl)acetyl-CoA isomerase PaaG [Paramagnetospirillum magneticum]|uniref:Enoyl-CoA hydratase/carnithine racemase n=1 Tax=Paramagnetospirillum magneticum (strain ATCC 700264 / AMB-1) TaxID=342108 RepID=Q2WAZ3_PARM1|nr:2-(1,2-epoxy-1,2-dihydrophenyl)acetyl-CoA isomerase PaaG [Paramagnetospirillum magneticum]BAE48982.1 Enoyl-CoA hydratase/carnithine racemase [Paramagnetospirillum magneticum AMB-1]